MVDRRRVEHSSLTPYEREERARQAARARWDRNPYDRDVDTQPAREAFLRRFEDEVDPERRLEPHVRARRADAAMGRYFTELEARKRQ